eukprot:3503007-Lingulodinium_polyedra.AAC.1
MGEALNVWGAFSGNDNPRAKRAATDYSDQWFSEQDSEFNVFYCCRAMKNNQTGCATTINSKIWELPARRP